MKSRIMSALVDTLVNSMETFMDSNDFEEYLNNEYDIDSSVAKKMFADYWKISATDRFEWEYLEWSRWLKRYGIRESVMKIEKKKEIIEIQEEVRIPQGNQELILEKGDQIEVLKNDLQEEIDIKKIVKDASTGSDVYSLVNGQNRLIPKNVYSKFTKESWNPIDAMSLAMGDLLRGMIDEFFKRFTHEEIAIILKKSKAQWNGILDQVTGSHNIRM